jgi:UDP-N-acetylmuramoylalanine--D-glutamate ligase
MTINSRAQDPPVRLDEPIAVFGVGVEGVSTISYLLSHGATRVTALDAKGAGGLPPGVEVRSGDGYDRDLGRFATVFRSPGIRPDHPALAEARARGTVITSALSLFLSRCPSPVIGVTGTLGKGTACSLATACLEAAGLSAHLGGNIGKNPLDFLDTVRADHRVVLEISSFQAMDLAASPEVAVVLKTTSEHLDWHLDTAEYRAAKAGLVAHQTPDDAVVFNAESEGAREIAAASPGRRVSFAVAGEVDEGIFVRGDALVWRRAGDEELLPFDAARMRLVGRFNLENVAAGVAAALTAGAAVAPACRAAESFGGLPHRLERVAEANGVVFFNDSYATRPEAAIAALEAFDAPLALILGGSEKHADFGPLARALVARRNIVYVALIGATAPRLEAAILGAGTPRIPLVGHATMEAAMEACAAAVRSRGGVVLLSPACASFGLFQNYKVRGEKFRAKALELAGLRG